MATRSNRGFQICIPILLLFMACGQRQLVQPDLITVKFQSPDKKIENLGIIDYSSINNSQLPLETIKIVQTSGKLFLGFSQVLDGSLIEQVQQGFKKNEITPILNQGILQLWVCDTQGANCIIQPTSGYVVTYRPDGGYIPPSDTPVSEFPVPAIQVEILPKTPLKNDSIVLIYLLANKIGNSENKLMSQILDSEGKGVLSKDGVTPVAGAAWFKTKHFGIVSSEYIPAVTISPVSPAQVSIQFNNKIFTTISVSNFSIPDVTITDATLDPSGTVAILTLQSPISSAGTYNVTVTGLGIGSTQFTVSEGN